jgi:tetratricopeptide (TPR) repeat protein
MTDKKPKKAYKIRNKNETGFLEKISHPKFSIFIIIIFILITYSRSFETSLVHFDDDGIFRNLETISFEKSNIITEAFTRDAWASKDKLFYRPLQTLFFLALPAKTSTYNFLLLILHILNTVVLYLILNKIFDEKSGRVKNLLLALIFGVHPLFIYSVNWIPAIGDSLMTFFVMLSFLCFILFYDSKKYIFLIGHLLAFFFAMFSKETAIVLPFAVLGFIFIRESFRVQIKALKSIIIPAMFWIAIPSFYLILRSRYLQMNEVETLTISAGPILGNIPVFFEMAMKFVFPIKLSLISFYSIFRIVTGIVIFALLVFYLIRTKQFRTGSFGLFWFVLFLAPTILFQNEKYDYLEHRAYLPLVGIFFMLSSIKLYKNEKVIYAILIPVFLVMTMASNKYFGSPIAFYDHVINNTKNNAMAYLNRGFYKDNVQNLQGALSDYNEAIKINPEYIDALINRGNLLSQKFGNLEAGLADLEKAINLVLQKEGNDGEALKPYFDVLNNMGIIKQNTGNIQGAMETYNTLIMIKPDFVEGYYNRGILNYEKLNDVESALADFNKVIEINPKYFKAYINRGVIKETELNRYDDAIKDYNKAIELKPDFAMAWFNRGMCYLQLGQINNACSDWSRAANYGSNDAKKLINQWCR